MITMILSWIDVLDINSSKWLNHYCILARQMQAKMLNGFQTQVMHFLVDFLSASISFHHPTTPSHEKPGIFNSAWHSRSWFYFLINGKAEPKILGAVYPTVKPHN
jgi:hypothetical protein